MKKTIKKYWIYRTVDPVTRDNEYYSDWCEYQLVDEPTRNRILSHRKTKNYNWKDYERPEKENPVL